MPYAKLLLQGQHVNATESLLRQWQQHVVFCCCDNDDKQQQLLLQQYPQHPLPHSHNNNNNFHVGFLNQVKNYVNQQVLGVFCNVLQVIIG